MIHAAVHSVTTQAQVEAKVAKFLVGIHQKVSIDLPEAPRLLGEDTVYEAFRRRRSGCLPGGVVVGILFARPVVLSYPALNVQPVGEVVFEGYITKTRSRRTF